MATWRGENLDNMSPQKAKALLMEASQLLCSTRAELRQAHFDFRKEVDACVFWKKKAQRYRSSARWWALNWCIVAGALAISVVKSLIGE